MNAPLKPTAMNVLTTSSTPSSAVLNDLVSRMNAQTGGTMQEEQKAAFSKWLERHTSSTASADAVNQAAKATPVQMNAPQPAQQAVKAPEHQPEKQPNKQAQKSTSKSSDQQVANKNNQSKAAAKDKTHDTDQVDDAAEATEVKDPSKVKFSTAMGDGTAEVRELKAPKDVGNDPASVMAWLSGLAQSDAKLAVAHADSKEAGLGKFEGRGGKDSGAAALNALLSGQGVDAKDALQGKADAAGIDISAWQSSQAMAQLSLQTAIQSAGTNGDGANALGDPLAGLAAAQANALARPGAEAGGVSKHVADTLSNPVTSPQFADELAEKVAMFVGKAKDDGPMTAELHLNPAEMGPISVKIAVDGQNAQIDFAAAALETRKAIEASMPMLSNALDEVGLSLTGGGVSSQTPQQGFNQSFSQSNGSSGNSGDSRLSRIGEVSEEPMGRPVNMSRLSQRGGLDLYA